VHFEGVYTGPVATQRHDRRAVSIDNNSGFEGVVTLSQTERNLPTIANVDARDFSDLACWLIVQIGPISLNVTTPVRLELASRPRSVNATGPLPITDIEPGEFLP
jgi:hypothetical protein